MSLLHIPTVTIEDLRAFQASHFPHNPVSEANLDSEDGVLGHYPDGVERTLTDEQIQIFRHGEIQSLLRERRAMRKPSVAEDAGQYPSTAEGLDLGNMPKEKPSLNSAVTSDETPLLRSEDNTRTREGNNPGRSDSELPAQWGQDLHKNTKEIDKLFSSLEYDEDCTVADTKRTFQSPSVNPTFVGRKIISYED